MTRKKKAGNPRRDGKPSICFVSLNSYSIIAKREDIQHIGGAEVQQWLISTWLFKHGYSVSFVTLDHGQDEPITHGGIKIYKAYREEQGIPGIRFLFPRWSGLWSALVRANADLYYQRGASSETGQVALWCKWHNRSFVFASASEKNCLRALPFLREKRERFLYRLGLWLANVRLVQTKRQQTLLREQFRLPSRIIRNSGISLHTKSLLKNTFKKNGILSVLWVGRFVTEKRFEMLIDVAEKCSDISFTVAGSTKGVSGTTVGVAIPPNVFMKGEVPFSSMFGLYKEFDILCCTSSIEGFPNTFLEAWRVGVPIVSTFDPDGIIESEGLGWTAYSSDKIAETLRRVSNSKEVWEKASKSARKYFQENHTLEKVMPEFERLILDCSGYTELYT